jgi:nucleoside-diphosphate-sugar epimerase
MPLHVAVTGPTGTFGHGLLPLLQEDPRVERVVGIARRPFDPAAEGWSKMAYRQGDVRDEAALREAFAGADVVVHLAFLITGGSEETTRAINVEGTRNAFRAAAAAGVKRFVYASSVAAYGFHRDNPLGMTEEWPVRPAERLFYAREKAEVEQVLAAEAQEHPGLDLYVLRPPVVVGPHALGGKVPGPLGELVERLLLRRSPVPLPVVVPNLPLQLVHEDDVGTAFLQCVVAAGPPGAYNIAGPGVPTLPELARVAGLRPVLTLPARQSHGAARRLAKLPGLPTFAQWVEALATPAVVDTTRARQQLGWQPRWSGLDAWRDTLERGPGAPGA